MDTFKKIVLSIIAAPLGLVAGIIVGVASFFGALLDVILSLYQKI